ncbi:mannitol dehydrogenase Rossmann domain protein [Anoxybacillus sp. B7M1]|uniref:mannitol-1-phosphate 5-dehydrogenase n=1 Tax=unclassified Anoxybacillus TaxID=2639704 RepID=UPI0005CDB0DE|nr:MULTISPECIES: mannitol-1-phosphate 5-dehydrogenase [unclassified Anoxybacillus]ANB58634.1 mannitol dehydrogenase Rossmann domain protein [Anoxybacillus sp. B2M1]ANB63735.1 mannitol dehydrogenase Rossmann domain protein [Anoxybacillus sp. B7M1]
MLAVHFGAGNIGRGFIGQLLSQSGYEVVFVDVNEEIVQKLQEKRHYRVIIAGEQIEEQHVYHVTALHSVKDHEAVLQHIAKADFVTTAVGPNVLPLIAPVIAEGIRKRLEVNRTPVYIIACENMIGGSSFLKEHVWKKLSEEEQTMASQYCSFPNCAVDRIVPNQKNEDLLSVTVEPFFEWVIETKQMIGTIPPIEGVRIVDELPPYIERKLFTVNTGHALVAYLGYYKKFFTIHEAMKDEEIYADVVKALNESGRVLIQKYGWNADEHQIYIKKIVQRFTKSAITDEVTRVGRSPIRKLGPNDRLISPAKQYYDLFHEIPSGLVKGIAALLQFDYQEDTEAMELQETIRQMGIEGALSRYAGLELGHPLIAAVKTEAATLAKQ